MSQNSKTRIRLFVAICLLLFLPIGSALARFLDPTDFDNFHKLTLRMQPIGFELGELMINPPSPNLAAATRTQNCIIRLSGTFDTVDADFSHVKSLVGLAAKMTDSGDELLVIRLLGSQASGFIENLKNYRRMLNITAMTCSDDGATVAKSREISRIWDDVGLLVDATLKKIGASKDSWRGQAR